MAKEGLGDVEALIPTSREPDKGALESSVQFNPLIGGRRVKGRVMCRVDTWGQASRTKSKWWRTGRKHGVHVHGGSPMWGCAAGFQAGLGPGDGLRPEAPLGDLGQDPT